MDEQHQQEAEDTPQAKAERDRARIESEIAGTDGGIDPFAAAVRATRMPMIVADPNQPDNPIVFVNNAFCKLTGYDRDEILGRNCRFLQGPETNPATVALIREAVAADLTGWLWTGLIERISQDRRSWTCGEVRRRTRSRSCGGPVQIAVRPLPAPPQDDR